MPDDVFIDGETVRLLPLEERDSELLKELWNAPGVWKTDYQLPAQPITSKVAQSEYESMAKGSDAVTATVEREGDRIGIGGISEIDDRARTANVGAHLLPEYQKDGYGQEVIGLLTAFCFDQLNLQKVIYKIIAFNEPAVALVENFGAQREGVLRQEAFTDGEYHDVLQYGIMEDEWDGLSDQK